MSYEAVIAGLTECFLTIPSLNRQNGKGQQVGVLAYEPTSIQAPALYMLLDRFERVQTGQVTAMRYFVLCRLCIKWQDNEKAELELMTYVNSIAAAVDVDPTLDGRIHSGLAKVDGAETAFVSIGNTIYRALDVLVNVLYKAPVKSGI